MLVMIDTAPSVASKLTLHFRHHEVKVDHGTVDDIDPLAEEAESELLDIIENELENEEVIALLRLARRVRDGQLRYGPLNLRHDTRDWFAERQAELDDGDIYQAYEETQGELKSRFKTDPSPAPAPPAAAMMEPAWEPVCPWCGCMMRQHGTAKCAGCGALISGEPL